MIRNILVPLDGSPFAEHALPMAVGLARRHNAALRLALVHVPVATTLIDGVPQFSAELDSELRTHETGYLDAISSRLHDETGLSVSAQLLDGAVADALADHATADGADLVVMSTHGRGGLSRAWLGSVADGLVRQAPVPVLLVRPDEDAEPTGEVAPLRRVLVPLDGSTLAETALAPAITLARQDGATLSLLRVVVPLTAAGLTLMDGYGLQEDLEARRAGAATYLEHIAGTVRDQGVAVETRCIVGFQPAAEILAAADESGADLVALASHGRSGIGRWALGSVSDKVVRAAEVPVLLCRQEQEAG